MISVQDLENLREELIMEINTKINHLIEQNINNAEISTPVPVTVPQNYELIYPLNKATGIFKGKRPIAIIFPNSVRKATPTWKSVTEEILKDCCKDSEKRQALLNLRKKILGRDRILLDSEPGQMRSPLEIDETLYLETHYDTETLLRILTTRILDVVGYDYSKINIAIKAQ